MFNCIVKPQVMRKRTYRKWLAGWILCDGKCLPLAESGLTSTIYFVPSRSHLYLGMRGWFVLNESPHSCPRFLGRVVFKQSTSGVVLRLSIKNTRDISPSPGAVCQWCSLAPSQALSPPICSSPGPWGCCCRSNTAMRFPSAGVLFWWMQFRRVWVCCHKICVSDGLTFFCFNWFSITGPHSCIVSRQNQNLLGSLSAFRMNMSLGGKVLRN